MGSDRNTPWFGAALTSAFGTTALMGTIWFVIHHPAVHASGPLRGLLLLGAFAAVMFVLGRTTDRAARAGAAAGAITALLQLILLGGAVFSEADADGAGIRPNAAIAVGGYIALCVLSGMACAAAGSATARSQGPPQPHAYWLSRFAFVAALAVAPLILIGGFVTSTESGLAVPDWPSTFGANMFLYPINLMTRDRVFEEHAHRLFGSLVGLTTLTLMLYTLIRERSRGLRVFAVVLFVLVVVQGVLGGIRVTEQSAALGIAHGVLAQVFLALMVAFAMLLSPARLTDGTTPDAASARGRVRAIGPILLGALLLQLTLGAGFRHLHGAGSPGATHMIWTHAAFAVVVAGLALFVGLVAGSCRTLADPAARSMGRAGGVMVVSVVLQLALGVVALILILTADRTGPVPTAEEIATAEEVPWLEAAMATAHQANGALLVAMAVLAWAWARWPVRASASPVTASSDS